MKAIARFWREMTFTKDKVTGSMRNARAVARAKQQNAGVDWRVQVLAFAVALMALLAAGVAQAKAAPESFSGLAKKLLPTVVNISTTQTVEGRPGMEMPQLPPGSPFEDFFREFFERNGQAPRQRRATSLGSGFIVDAEGHIVTNNHVIDGADEISVILHDDTRLKAELIGRDPKTDLAVLKVEYDGNLPVAEIGDSDES